MNPFDLSASDLLIWGVVLHLIADWPLQNDWMARYKMHRRKGPYLKTVSQTIGSRWWWDRHPAAYVHSGIHGVLLAVVFGWAAIPLAFVHLAIDTRVPVAWWSKLIGQTQPKGEVVHAGYNAETGQTSLVTLFDIGTNVRFWTDQVFHIACIAIAAVLIGG